MARGGRSGGFRSGSTSRSSSPTRSQPTMAPPKAQPKAQPQAPPMAPTQQGPGLMGTLAQGMAFGAGSEIAHQAIRSVIGGGSHSQPAQQEQAQPQEQQQSQQQKCQTENSNFIECLKFNNNTIAYCQNQFDLLTSCQKGGQ